MTQLVDYSFSRPSAASIAAAGFIGVVRYLSGNAGKDLSAGERDALHAAGLAIALVWETDGVTTGGAGVGAVIEAGEVRARQRLDRSGQRGGERANDGDRPYQPGARRPGPPPQQEPEHDRPDQVELLFHGQRPHVQQR